MATTTTAGHGAAAGDDGGASSLLLAQAVELVQEKLPTELPSSPQELALLRKFLETRNGDVASAAERYVNHVKLVREFDLSTQLSREILDALKLGALFEGPHDKEGRPSVFVWPARLDWKAVTVAQMRKVWYFQMMRIIMKNPTAQSKGMNAVANGAGVSMSTIRREFQAFVGRAVNECMPTKINRIYFVNEPWIFGSLLWPIVSFFLKEKLRARVRVIGTRYEELLVAFDASNLPVQVGGTREMNVQEEITRCCEEFGVDEQHME
jgi:hypothetical protein